MELNSACFLSKLHKSTQLDYKKQQQNLCWLMFAQKINTVPICKPVYADESRWHFTLSVALFHKIDINTCYRTPV